jgi:hypothetical protein
MKASAMPEPHGRMINRRAAGLIALIMLNLLLCGLPPGSEAAEPVEPAQTAKPAVVPFQTRVDREIELLTRETTEETLARLSVVDMYYWPGSTGGGDALMTAFPLPPSIGECDVDRLLSCRRIVKAYQNLSALSKSDAADLVNRHLKTSLNAYEKMYLDYMRTAQPLFRAGTETKAGPSFVIGGTDQPTLIGYRLQVLGLVFLAGNLELRAAAPSVLAVAKQATEEYDRLRADNDSDLGFRDSMAHRGALYSRQALAVGLVGTMANYNDPVASKYRGQMKAFKWPAFNARTPPFNQPALPGEATDSDMTLEFRTFGDLTDENLAEIVAAASKMSK